MFGNHRDLNENRALCIKEPTMGWIVFALVLLLPVVAEGPEKPKGRFGAPC